MTKILREKIKNARKISEADIELKGATILFTGKNGVGKSTATRTIYERFANSSKVNILKKDEKAGYCIWYLTDGNTIEWNFKDDGNDSIHFFECGAVKQKKYEGGVISHIQRKYFGEETFDIDKFLKLQPKQKQNIISAMVGIDFSEIDAIIEEAKLQRKKAKDSYDFVKKQHDTFVIAPEAEKPDIDALNAKKVAIQAEDAQKQKAIETENAEILRIWNEKETVDFNACEVWNNVQKGIETKNKEIRTELAAISSVLKHFICCFDSNRATQIIASLSEPDFRTYTKSPQPELAKFVPQTDTIMNIDNEIREAYLQLNKYNSYILSIEAQKELASSVKIEKEKLDVAEKILFAAEEKKKLMLQKADLPAGFEFTNEGLFYNGFLFDADNQATSALYIGVLKLATMKLGELRVKCFDASPLDRDSFNEVVAYANSIDLQLLIERPDFDGGDLRWEIIENND